jgi:hypothetical protein
MSDIMERLIAEADRLDVLEKAMNEDSGLPPDEHSCAEWVATLRDAAAEIARLTAERNLDAQLIFVFESSVLPEMRTHAPFDNLIAEWVRRCDEARDERLYARRALASEAGHAK